MPYITLPNGSLKYVVSRWTKDDLPTWHELYYDFYIPEKYDYTPGNYQLIDPYWKIPRQVYLLATACNQMNKMLVEDGAHEDVLVHFNKKYRTNYDRLFFRLNPDENTDPNDPDPIYSLPHPQGLENIFAIKDTEYRVDVKDMLGSSVSLKLCASEDGRSSFQPHYVMTEVIAYILQSVISYFQGNVGWK